MKKSAFVLLISSVFLIFSVSTSFAGYRHYPSYHHHGHGGIDVLVPLGFGLIAGAIIAGAAAQPPPSPVIYRQAPPPVIVSPPVQYYSFSPAPLSEELVINRVSITTGLLNVRSGPGLETPVIDQVRLGEILDVIGASPGWLYIRTSSGEHGWVMTKFTSIRTTPAG
jgi:uncharacterized protein YgiM (DUF1202 family)